MQISSKKSFFFYCQEIVFYKINASLRLVLDRSIVPAVTKGDNPDEDGTLDQNDGKTSGDKGAVILSGSLVAWDGGESWTSDV